MPTQPLLTKTITEPDVVAASFRNQWLNFTLYLPQFMYKTKRKASKNDVCTFMVDDKQNRLKGNSQPIGGGLTNTQFLANGANYKTEFIQVDKRDLVNMYERVGLKHGYSSESLPTVYGTEYRHDSDTNNNRDKNGIFYFFRGLLEADCLRFLREKNII